MLRNKESEKSTNEYIHERPIRKSEIAESDRDQIQYFSCQFVIIYCQGCSWYFWHWIFFMCFCEWVKYFFFRKRQWNTFEMWEVKSRGVAWKMLCNNGAVWRVPTRWVCLDIPTYMKGQWKKTYLLLSTSTTRFLPLLECRRYHRCR